MKKLLCLAVFLSACSNAGSDENATPPNGNSAPPSGNSTMMSILPLGDSITEGVPYTYRYPLHTLLTEANYKFDFVGSHTIGGNDYPDGWDRDNEGHAGWTTESIDMELTKWLPGYSVDVALIHLGTNDVDGQSVENSYTAMLSIVNQLRAKNPSVSICLAQILPFGAGITAPGKSPSFFNDFVQSLNTRLGDLASQYSTSDSPIKLVDMNTGFGEADLDDGVHPTEEGARRMAQKWLECISSL